MTNEIITSLERVNEKYNNNLKEAKFELMKPKNLVCEFNFIVSDLHGIYTVNTTYSQETNNKHYQLEDCSPSNVARWTKESVKDIVETYQSEQGIELKVVEYNKFLKSQIEKLTALINSNNKMIKSLK